MIGNLSNMKVGDWGLVTAQGYRRLVKVIKVTPAFVSVDGGKYRVKDGLEWGGHESPHSVSRRYLCQLTSEELKTIRAEIYREQLIDSVRVQCDLYSLRKLTTDKLEQLNAILGNM